MIFSQISRRVGDLKARNKIIGVENSNKLTKCISQESKYKSLIESGVVGKEKAVIKEIYILFEMPEHKMKWIQNLIEIGEFITKAKDPNK